MTKPPYVHKTPTRPVTRAMAADYIIDLEPKSFWYRLRDRFGKWSDNTSHMVDEGCVSYPEYKSWFHKTLNKLILSPILKFAERRSATRFETQILEVLATEIAKEMDAEMMRILEK